MIKIQLPTFVPPLTLARDHYKNKTGIMVNPLRAAACIAEFASNVNDKHIPPFYINHQLDKCVVRKRSA